MVHRDQAFLEGNGPAPISPPVHRGDGYFDLAAGHIEMHLTARHWTYVLSPYA